MADYSLQCPFLDESPAYAFGVEFGMLWAQMRDPGCDLIEGLFSRANQDQILLAASRLGWRVASMRPVLGPCALHWLRIRLERVPR